VKNRLRYEETHKARVMVFRFWWSIAEEENKCDAMDGCEYKRVFAEWIGAGSPSPVYPFIVNRANIDSNGKEPGFSW
jgi:hypothetical protein